jgi:L-histidine Nalpha-methyltransferase
MSVRPATLPDAVNGPSPEDYLAHVLDGLARPQKTLPCKYFYDAQGSELFEAICRQPEYYPSEREMAILETYGPAMADGLGEESIVIEYGSGGSVKTRLLLNSLCSPLAYVPIDISYECLNAAADALRLEYPRVQIIPVWADYTQPLTLPASIRYRRGRAVYFPGSTIGNFHPPDALQFLQTIADVAGPGGALLIGVDLRKDVAVLEAAYNDAAGVTAAFNKNILARINRELGGKFDLDAFRHFAAYNREAGRIEMHLVSVADQEVAVGGHCVHFRAGESIRTECSYKYTVPGFAGLARGAGFRVEQVWTDPDEWFSVQLLRVHL